MSNIVTVEANAILASSVTGTAYTAPTTPVNLALITDVSASSATAYGSEVSGGSYARVSTASQWGTASGGTITNTGSMSFTGMPACTIAGIELWDSKTRTLTDLATTTSTTITSATALFTQADVGAAVTSSGGDIPAGARIASVTNGTTAVLSAAATGTHSGQNLVITGVRRWFGALSANKTVNLGDTVTFATSSISITLS